MSTTTTSVKEKDSRVVRAIGNILKYILLIVVCLIVFIPILYVILGSFKQGNIEIYNSGAYDLPNSLDWSNYQTALDQGRVLQALANTAILIVVCCFGTIITGTMTAFVVQRFKTLLSRAVKTAFLVAVLLPNISMQVTVYQIVNKLGLVGSMWSLIIMWIGTDIVSVYIFIQFLNQIPTSLDESGIVDGATYPRIYWSIILPNLRPAIATVLIMKFVTIYNDYFTPYLYMRDKPVVSTALQNIMNGTTVEYPAVFAGVIICILPTLIIFLALQKQVYSGLVSGAVKG